MENQYWEEDCIDRTERIRDGENLYADMDQRIAASEEFVHQARPAA